MSSQDLERVNRSLRAEADLWRTLLNEENDATNKEIADLEAEIGALEGNIATLVLRVYQIRTAYERGNMAELGEAIKAAVGQIDQWNKEAEDDD